MEFMFILGAIVEKFDCTDGCVGELVHCYCNTSTSNIDWTITLLNGTSLVYQQFNLINSQPHNESGFYFTYNSVTYSSNVTFLLNESLAVVVECDNGGENSSSSESRIIHDRGEFFQ